MRRLLSVAVLLAVAAGCRTIHRQVAGQWLPGQSYKTGSAILFTRVPDGVEHGEGSAIGTGAAFAAMMRDQMLRKSFQIVMSEKASVTEALPEAVARSCGYILKAVITEWEENATEWSGKPDTMAVSAELYAVPDGTLVATANYRVIGSDTLFASRDPQRFYPEVADHILGSFFGWRPTILTAR